MNIAPRLKRIPDRLAAPAESVRVDVDADTAERILVPLIENGCRYGRSRVEMSVEPNGDAVEFWSATTGPSTEGHQGAGLGLALARRLARAVAGDVEALRNGAGGSFRARIPLAHGR